jgi:hypothetical protein
MIRRLGDVVIELERLRAAARIMPIMVEKHGSDNGDHSFAARRAVQAADDLLVALGYKPEAET